MPETPLSTDDQCTGKVPFLKDYYFEKVYTATAGEVPGVVHCVVPL